MAKTIVTNGDGYEYIQEDGELAMSMHRLTAVAEYGLDAIDGMDVHHKISIGWYNTCENLEPQDSYEHRLGHLGIASD